MHFIVYVSWDKFHGRSVLRTAIKLRSAIRYLFTCLYLQLSLPFTLSLPAISMTVCHDPRGHEVTKRPCLPCRCSKCVHESRPEYTDKTLYAILLLQVWLWVKNPIVTKWQDPVCRGHCPRKESEYYFGYVTVIVMCCDSLVQKKKKNSNKQQQEVFSMTFS